MAGISAVLVGGTTERPLLVTSDRLLVTTQAGNQETGGDTIDNTLLTGLTNTNGAGILYQQVATLHFNGTSWDRARNNISKTLKASATASASVTVTDTNYDARGLIAFFNIATLPGSLSTTIALKIRAVDPVTGGLYTLATQAARSATGMTTLVIYPGAASAANSSTSIAAPRDLSFLLSMSSAATSIGPVFSLGVQYLK